ncbi:MAG: lipid II:glycine glycyltransferase FemX [Planctomycetota bacterium]|jgi:hypothetical protein
MQIIDPLSSVNWDERLGCHQKLSFFHGKAWARVLYETYRYRPMYFCTLDSDTIVNLLPLMEVRSFLTGRRGVSLPFTDYCEPILTDGTGLDQVLEGLQEHGQQRRWQCFQIRGGNGVHAVPDEQYYVHELPLQNNTERLFGQLRPAKRRNIRKAKKQQIDIQHTDDLAALNAYYRLHCRTRKRHGMPPQPYRFFHNIYQYVIAPGQGKVVLGRFQDRVIAGCIFFHFRKKALYKFGASDMAFQHLRPNDLIMWNTIQWYASRGYETFCFGRTGLSNSGLRRFKSDWGTQERTVNYYRYDFQRQDFVTSHPAVKPAQKRLFQMLPVPALKLFGSVAYRHMG